MNAEFEEWLEEMAQQFELNEHEVFVVREAYRLGLQRGCQHSILLTEEVNQELQVLNEGEV